MLLIFYILQVFACGGAYTKEEANFFEFINLLVFIGYSIIANAAIYVAKLLYNYSREEEVQKAEDAEEQIDEPTASLNAIE